MGIYSKLHNETYAQIKSKYPELVIKENYRPEWLLSRNLTKLEIDIYIETLDTAIEIQGLQHYEFVPHFHKTYDKFLEQRYRDQEKRDLCQGHKTKLVEIACSAELNLFMQDLSELMERVTEFSAIKKFIAKPHTTRMRSKKYRKWLWRKKHPEYRIEHPVPPIIKLPGNNRQRNYARQKLQFCQMDINFWKVWGGVAEHLVFVTPDGIYSCDCYMNKILGNMCTHIIKVKHNDLLNATGKPTKRLEQSCA